MARPRRPTKRTAAPARRRVGGREEKAEAMPPGAAGSARVALFLRGHGSIGAPRVSNARMKASLLSAACAVALLLAGPRAQADVGDPELEPLPPVDLGESDLTEDPAGDPSGNDD